MLSTNYGGTEYRFFDHLYAVSRDGLVLRQLLPYKPKMTREGYLSAGRERLVHRMVAKCWVAQPEGSNHVHHKDHDKTNNRADNLEWVTPKHHMGDLHPNIVANHPRSEAWKQKLRAYRLGMKTAESTKQKQREASLRLGSIPPPWPVGKKHTPEAVARMRDNHGKNTACIVHGVIYQSFSAAGRALGEKPHSLRKRCLSENFPDYRILE
jgi:hypothetical protein